MGLPYVRRSSASQTRAPLHTGQVGTRRTRSATALTLMLGVGFLVLPVMVLVLTLPTWEQRVVDAQDAARSAARPSLRPIVGTKVFRQPTL